ncbi:ABC transporter permease [Gudongella sp. DL1XJH-153]|uniref:ABC transporter permease n=1 Tax=Gudongella sp. DL1XJH-153 TaxID=3409804 RepID=UPI003BB592B8
MRAWYSFLKDLKVSFKSLYIYIEIIMALVIVLVFVFVLPDDFSPNLTGYVYISDSVKEYLTEDELRGLQEEENLVEVEDKSLIPGMLKKDRNSIGFSLYHEEGKMVYDIVLQGYEGEEAKKLLQEGIMAYMATEFELFESKIQYLTLEDDNEKLSDRINLLPVFLMVNTAFMGLFIVSTYIFMDKEEGTIKALAVTPTRIWEYLLGKVGVILVTGLATGMLTVFLIMGNQVHYLQLFVLLAASNVFGTSAGLLLSSFYDNIMKSMSAMYLTIMTFLMGAIPYFLPGFSPWFIKILPSYPMVFSFREVFLENPDAGYVYRSSLLFIVLAIILFAMANQRFKKTITA